MGSSSIDIILSLSLLSLSLQGRSQDFPKGGSQCVTPRVLSTSPCREYFDAKQISTVSFLTVVFGAKVLKILQICAFSPPKYCMLFILEIKSLPKGGSRAPQDPPSLRPCIIVISIIVIVIRLIYTVRLCRMRQAYDRPTTRIIICTYNSLTTPKSCHRPVVSLSHGTKSYHVNRPIYTSDKHFVYT